MSILIRLKEDHNEARELLKKADQLLEEFPAIDEHETENLIEDLVGILEAHNRVEEDVFYDALKEKNQDLILPYSSYEEHKLAENLLESLTNDELNNEEIGAKLRVLKKVVLQHIEEEESTVFKYAQECFSPKELEELGWKFSEKKKKLIDEKN